MKTSQFFSSSMNGISRRDFIGQANCAALGSAALTSAALNLNLLGRISGAELPPENGEDDYKALVCVFLSGGNDSFNMVAPAEGDGYLEYASSRGDLSIPQSGEEGGLLPLDGQLPLPDGRQLGVHPSIPFLQELYNLEQVAIVANVGTLVEPTTLASFANGVARLPEGLFSHSDQMMQWQTSLPDQRSAATGWGGRMSDLLDELNTTTNVSMNVSGSGNNLFQTGVNTTTFALNANGSIQLTGGSSSSQAARRQAIDGILGAEYQNAFERAFARRKQGALRANVEYREAVELAPAIASPFSSNNALSLQLRNVARTISARNLLCKRRQTFFVELGGFDLHAKLGTGHTALLTLLNTALSEFKTALLELEVWDNVTTFTSSDFSRTLGTNGSGADHAWGGNHFVFGGGVDGGKVYGTYPSLALGSEIDTGRGRLIPSTSVDEYVSDLALWMGVSPSSLPLVLPNLSRFHAPATAPAMGYMK